MAKALTGVEAKDLRSLADEGKKKLGSGIVDPAGERRRWQSGLVVGVTADLTAANNAVTLVQTGVAALGGKGRRRTPRHGARRRPERREPPSRDRGDQEAGQAGRIR